jgi:hypothetical protein
MDDKCSTCGKGVNDNPFCSNSFHVRETMQDRISSLEAKYTALREAMKKELIHMYNRGYKAGHHDTVECGYVDIFDVDMDSYHEDVIDEIIPEEPELRALLTDKEAP